MLTTPRGFAAALTPLSRSLRVFLACAALVLTTALVLPAGSAHAAATTTVPSGTTFRAQLLAGVNAQRSAHGLPALRLSTCPNDTYAQPWAVYMAIHHSMVHQSMSRMLSGCHASYAAENIGVTRGTAAGLVSAWMASAPHRANILSRSVRYIGVGAAHYQGYTWYAALDFTG